jgi:hypothetical protein
MQRTVKRSATRYVRTLYPCEIDLFQTATNGYKRPLARNRSNAALACGCGLRSRYSTMA